MEKTGRQNLSQNVKVNITSKKTQQHHMPHVKMQCEDSSITSVLFFSSVQLLSRVRLSATPWIAAHQASLSITNSRSSLKLTSIESVMPSSHLILCRPLLPLPPIPPSIRVFSSESILRWGGQSIGVSNSPSNYQSRQHIKKQRHYFINKGPSSQGYGFSSSQVWMWELDYKESWAQKNWCFWTVVLEKTLESPLDCKEIQPVHSKGDQSWVFFGWNSSTLATSWEELTHWKRL